MYKILIKTVMCLIILNYNIIFSLKQKSKTAINIWVRIIEKKLVIFYQIFKLTWFVCHSPLSQYWTYQWQIKQQTNRGVWIFEM